MSKGLSKLQLAIVGLLDGSLKREFLAGSGRLDTGELLEELQGRGLIREGISKKVAMFTVRRACASLLNRGILEGEYNWHPDYPWAKAITWGIAKHEPPRKKTESKRKAN